MTVLWAQERHTRPTAATCTATDDTRRGGGNIHGRRRHAPWQRQHSQPQMTRMAAAAIRAARSSNAHGRSNLHGGGDNTHGRRRYGWWRRRHPQPAAATPTATEDTHDSDNTHGCSRHPQQRRPAWPQTTRMAAATPTAADDTHGSSGDTRTHGCRRQRRQDTRCGRWARSRARDALRMYDRLYFVFIVLVP